jgi:cytoskeletal protein RodZ
MKSKTSLWILIPAVLGIWGAIGWNVYSAMNGDEDNATLKTVESSQQTENKAAPDTFELLLDYPDPFTNDPYKQKTTAAVIHNTNNHQHTTTASAVQEEAAWPTIIYSGLVKQPATGKMLGFLSVNGGSYFVKEGVEVEGVRVEKISENGVVVLWNGQSKEIRK